MSSSTQSRWPLPALVGAVVLPPLTVRTLLLTEGHLLPGRADLLGVAADLGISLLLASVAAVAVRTSRRFRPVATALVAGWCVINFANYEHIRELGAMASLANAAYVIDPTFFRGSVLAPTHPLLLMQIVLASTIAAWCALNPDRRLQPLPVVVSGLALMVVAATTSRTDTIASWRQTDLVTAQGVRLLTSLGAKDPPHTIAHGSLTIRDLDGTPIIPDDPRARNVLLIILEGVSGAYIPSLAAHHEFTPLLNMQKLDQIARSGISYPSFVATQRQTNRGEYALLCGEYPKLLTSEATMSELVGRGPLECLPQALRRNGFSTHYLQAAPTPFMLKDQFMPQAGFDFVRGDEWFTHPYNRNHWGVDDRAFFEASLDMIRELNRGSDPWFLTLLTVGTHHRYNVPPSFEGTHEAGTAAWAFEYLDLAIGEFVSRLDSDGLLEDTLVLITSDESQAMEIGAPDASRVLTQAWGFLIALLPSRETGVVEEVFAQPDIPISVTDYLRLDNGAELFTGRSVFRRYDRQREIYWGNTHLAMVGGLTIDGDAIVCTEDFASCTAWATKADRIFSPPGQLRAVTGEEVDWLRGVASLSLGSDPEHLLRRRLQLISPGPHPVVRTAGEQYLFGGQFLSLPARSRADVEIEVEVTGPSGWVDLVHNFVVNLQPYSTRSLRLNAGETLHLHYSVNAPFDLDNVECRMWITAFEGDDLGLEFTTADINIVPLTGPEEVVEIVEHRFEITSGDHD